MRSQHALIREERLQAGKLPSARKEEGPLKCVHPWTGQRRLQFHRGQDSNAELTMLSAEKTVCAHLQRATPAPSTQLPRR